MTSKTSAKKASGRSYDSRTSEVCAKCSGTVVYRKSSYFGNKVYYKVCNNCGWYETMERDTWMERVFAIAEKEEPASVGSEPGLSEPTESSSLQEPEVQDRAAKSASQTPQEKSKRRRGRPPKSKNKLEE